MHSEDKNTRRDEFLENRISHKNFEKKYEGCSAECRVMIEILREPQRLNDIQKYNN